MAATQKKTGGRTASSSGGRGSGKKTGNARGKRAAPTPKPFRREIGAAVCLLPFVWIAFTQNHSYIHRWFVYRLLAICVFGGLCMLARLTEKHPAPRVGAGGEMAADAAARAPRQR